MIDCIEEYFESDDREVINPFEGDKGEDEAVIIKSLLFIDLVLIKSGDIFHSNLRD